eukprot:COSAG02_NODE_462_length_21838_cov_17.900501_1_plen_55_part_00
MQLTIYSSTLLARVYTIIRSSSCPQYSENDRVLTTVPYYEYSTRLLEYLKSKYE